MEKKDMEPEKTVDASETAQQSAPSRTLWSDAWHRLRRNKLAVIAIIWISVIVLIAVTADLWVPQWLGSPTDTDTTLSATMSKLPPSAEHPFGTCLLYTSPSPRDRG